MHIQSKKSFAIIDYERCDPGTCNPEQGTCPAAAACQQKVIKQIDGPFEQPMLFQNLCLGCWDCLGACPLEAVSIYHTS